jgi:hypothetical protein
MLQLINLWKASEDFDARTKQRMVDRFFPERLPCRGNDFAEALFATPSLHEDGFGAFFVMLGARNASAARQQSRTLNSIIIFQRDVRPT